LPIPRAFRPVRKVYKLPSLEPGRLGASTPWRPIGRGFKYRIVFGMRTAAGTGSGLASGMALRLHRGTAMKTRHAVGAAFISLAPWVPAVTEAQDALTITGTVVETDDASMIVQTDRGERKAFVIDTQTAMPSEGLRTGARVSVRYKRLDDSRLQAIGVTVLDSGQPPRRSSSSQRLGAPPGPART
jgi:hypothetical protein